MTVFRGFVQCKVCGENYILRVGIGGERRQIHSFECKNCEIPISIIVNTGSDSGTWLQPEENAIKKERETEDSTIINLHPSFAFDADEINNPLAFPSLSFGEKIYPYLRHSSKQDFEGIKNSRGVKFENIATQFDLPNAIYLWGVVKNIFLLHEKIGQEKEVSKAIEHYAKQRQKVFSETTANSLKEVTFNFFDSLFYPRFQQILRPATQLINEIRHNHPKEFSDFLIFYQDKLKAQHLRQYLSVFSDYFRIYDQLSQMLVFSRIGDEEVDGKIVGSKSFELTKLYYGQAYESITSVFVVLTCLNNIHLGRNYDQLKTATLSKYINGFKKESKAGPFEDTEAFRVFTEGLDGTIRNGSHHASIWRDGEKILYRSGGTGSQREIAYSRYLHLCNKLTISLSALFFIESALWGVEKQS
jgi:hypothetical protein